MLGGPAPEMIGKTVSMVLGEASADRLTDDKTPDSQFEIHTGEGESRRSYDVVSSPLGLGGGIGAGRLLVLRDITEREEAENALRASEDRYRQLFELESDAIMLVDDDSGRILEANTAATTLYGYSREEWLSMNKADVSRGARGNAWVGGGPDHADTCQLAPQEGWVGLSGGDHGPALR